jgi:hypothetical protein
MTQISAAEIAQVVSTAPPPSIFSFEVILLIAFALAAGLIIGYRARKRNFTSR